MAARSPIRCAGATGRWISLIHLRGSGPVPRLLNDQCSRGGGSPGASSAVPGILDSRLRGNARHWRPAGRDRKAQQAIVERSEEHTSELQSLMRTSYAVFCLKKKKTDEQNNQRQTKYHFTYSVLAV